MRRHFAGSGIAARLAAILTAALLTCVPASSHAAEPITIGFAEALTGGLAVVGKSGVLAAQIWADEVNAKGGLLGRPVKLVFYDNQSNASNVPGIYTKLLDVDHVDLIMSGYSTNMTAPAMPIAMGHNKLFVSLFCLAVNAEFHYPRYFSMLPSGPDPKHAFSRGFFDIAVAQEPQPKTVAIVAADAEFARNASDGARENAKAVGLRIVYDGTCPPTTTDYTPVIRAVRATNPGVIYVASYPPDTIGIPARGQLDRPEDAAVRRQHGGAFHRRAEDAARSAAQRHRGNQKPRRRQACRLVPRQHVQDDHRRRGIRQGWRVGGAAYRLDAVPERQGQRSRAVQGPGDGGRGAADRVQIRRTDLSLRGGEAIAQTKEETS
jgi:hypothetical protein